jgi:hypothetical protein
VVFGATLHRSSKPRRALRQKTLQHDHKILFSIIVALRKQSEGQNKAVRQMAMSAVDLACVPSVASSPARHSQTAYWAVLCKIVTRNRHSWRVNESSSNSVLEQGTTNQPKQGLSPLHLKRLLKTHTVPSRVVWKSMVPCAESSRVFATHLCLGRNAPKISASVTTTEHLLVSQTAGKSSRFGGGLPQAMITSNELARIERWHTNSKGLNS